MRCRETMPTNCGSAHYGKIFLQGVNAAGKGIGERVGGRESGEVREHHFAHVHRVDDGLEEDSLVLNLRADHDEEAGDDEPRAVQQHAGDHGDKSDQLAKSAGSAASGRNAVLAGEAAAQQATEIERIGRQQMEQSEAGLHPDHAAQQVGRSDPGLVEEMDVAARAQKRGRQRNGGGEICHGAGQRESKLPDAPIGVFLALGVGVGIEAADGKHENGAKPQTQPRSHEQGAQSRAPRLPR